MANNWSLLPYSILLNIAKHLTSIEDFLAFSSVCCSWRTVYTDRSWKPGSRVPWLMLSEDQNSESRGFYSLSNGKTYHLPVPEAQGKMCWGSPLGWILTFGPDFMLRLLNPVSRVEIDVARIIVHFEHYCFPPSKEWYRLLYKAVVLRGPADDGDFLVAVIFYQGNCLSFKSRDGPWKMLEDQVDLNYGFSDVLFLEGRIYALHGIGALVLVEMDGQGAPTVTRFAPPPQEEWAWEDAYLIESSGDLLMVQKLEYRGVDDVQFEVYKLDFTNKEWTGLDNLGDRSIFVGGNHSMAVAASCIGGGCKPNCIYFTGDGVEQWWEYVEDAEGRDMGVYNMSDGSVEPFFYGADYPSHYSSPVWIVPNYY